MGEMWKKVYSKSGVLLYEGFTSGIYPAGVGVLYYPNGNKYQEGIFGFKGLVSGREYYQDGQVRFDGVYRINMAYGPNEPLYGKFYDRQGELKYEGKFAVSHSGLGWPFVKTPEEYGPVLLAERPESIRPENVID